ncbi:hypothetical protein [Polaribacter sp. SA4-12]|uniref:hypothetical protein n=1 Tax=Polaribacter sp. SA4-12 TaxID=1312072 RepID=UPI000B3CCC59|nr:hypothetical protein [Polaribacter sp. SA4-12]ARV15920.1 hypothetical protein BTO07_12540 [Polaribacter sp. SA4-12]
MELTEQQLQRVEHYLNVKHITYIDLRMEVLDHIVSDIETKMTKENLDFETVFYNVTDKWNPQLKESSSWLFGIAFSAPKLVMKKAKTSYIKLFLISNFLMILLSIFERKLNLTVSDNTQLYLTNFLLMINLFCAFIFIYLMINNSKIKQKTTYRFILKTQKMGIILGGIAIIFSGVIKDVSPIYSLTLMFIAITFIYFHFLKKHKKAIKKYKVS